MRDADCGSVFISGSFLFIERLHERKFQGESVVSGSHFECGQESCAHGGMLCGPPGRDGAE
jgi:hypothetical protein